MAVRCLLVVLVSVLFGTPKVQGTLSFSLMGYTNIPNDGSGRILITDIGFDNQPNDQSLICMTNITTSGNGDYYQHASMLTTSDGARIGSPDSLGYRRNRDTRNGIVRLRRDHDMTSWTEGVFTCQFLNISDPPISVGVYHPITVSVSINVVSAKEKTFTVTCTTTGGIVLSGSLTGPGGVNITVFSSVGTRNYRGQDSYRASTGTRTGGSDGGIYWCTATNGVPAPEGNGSATLRVASAPTDLTAVQEGLTGIRVSWTPPTPLGDTTGYRIYYSGGSNDSIDVIDGSTNNHLLTGLQIGASYNISIVGKSDHFYSDCVNHQNSTRLSHLTAMIDSTTSTTISVWWTGPNGTVVESYDIKWERNNSGECPDVNEGNAIITNDSTNYTITELEEYSIYNITLTIFDAAGSAESASFIVMTKEAVPSAPPTSLSASDITYFSITVHWGPVNCIDHNGDIAGYSVRYEAQGSGSTQTLSVSEGDTTEATIFGLMHDTQYTIEVAAVTSAGIGIYSGSISSFTLALETPAITVIDSGKYARQYDEYIEIQVSWGPILLRRSTFYLITYYTTSQEKEQIIFHCSEEVPANTTTITRVVRDPVPGLTHVFTVRSIVRMQSKIIFESPEVNTSIVLDKKYFQLQFGSVDHCITWTREYAELLERRLQLEIKETIFKNCSMYRQFNNSVLLRGVFTCQSSPNMATYRSSLLNPSLPGVSNASNLVGYIQDWVSSGPVVRMDWLMVRINDHCPVAIGGLNDPECRPPSLLRPELINTINGVMNTCAVRSLGSQICQESFWNG